MKRIGLSMRWIACGALAVGGCGAFPDFLVDAGRDAAKEALEKSVEEAVEEILTGVVADIRDSIDVLPAPEADDEAARDTDRRR